MHASIESSNPTGDEAADLQVPADRQAATLTKSVYEQVRADILAGRMRPGEKIRAVTLRKRFNTATSPVREALNRLLSEGFVALEEQKGFRVAPVSREELKELVKTRCWIDGLAIREAIEQFEAQKKKLAELATAGGRRARGVVADAATEIQGMHAELARAVSAGLGLRALR